jgi:hypothetical protein
MISKFYDKLKSDVMGRGGDIEIREVDKHGLAAVVKSYAALVRVVGYVKYMSSSNVLMRGQTNCYGCMKPSAYRNTTARQIDDEVEKFLSHFRKKTGFDPDPIHQVSTEALLQHYGIRTRWLDLVDSLAHALFFAAYEMSKREGTYSFKGKEGDFAYVHLIDCGTDRDLAAVKVLDGLRIVNTAGVWETTDGFALCDLRRAKSSKALRPHAQHGYLCRPPRGESDLWTRVLLRIAFSPEQARSWLGNGAALSPEELFPDAKNDRVYGKLLSSEVRSVFEEYSKQTQTIDLGEIFEFSFHRSKSEPLVAESQDTSESRVPEAEAVPGSAQQRNAANKRASPARN